MMELPPPPAVSFPLVFFNGERDVDVGSVTINDSIGFSKFQSLVAHKIGGVSPHQISISLVRRKKARSSPEIRRKVPIDEASDFSSICRERDCFVLVVMRRSRRERRGRGRRGRGGGGVDDNKAVIKVSEILKREESVPIVGSFGLGFWGYERQMRDLQSMRGKYLMSTVPYYPYAIGGGYGSSPAAIGGGYGSSPAAVCEDCLDAKREGRSAGFHWCVYDKVTVGFRSPVGPIERPTKKYTEASV